jgi:hypothetical protein
MGLSLSYKADVLVATYKVVSNPAATLLNGVDRIILTLNLRSSKEQPSSKTICSTSLMALTFSVMEVVILKITLDGPHAVSDAQTVHQVRSVIRAAYPGKTVDLLQSTSRIILTVETYSIKNAKHLMDFALKAYTKLRKE